jgi:hypothetical protein
MPVSFAVLECESEAPKIAVRGWRMPPTKNYPLVASAARAPSDRRMTEVRGQRSGREPNSHHPAA